FQLIVILFVEVIMAGMLLAIYVSNFNTLIVLRGNFRRSKNGVWLRNGMLVLQFAIAAFFIVGSYIVHQQVNYMSNKDLGLKGDQVIEIYYRRPYYNDPAIMFNNYTVVKQELNKIKVVQSVAATEFSLGGGACSSSGFTYQEEYIQAKNMAADFGFLDMLQIKMVKGRALSDKFSSDTINGMMINETAMKLMKEKDPVGKTIDWNGE